MAGQQIARLRKDHGPGQCGLCGPAPEFAINKISQSARRKAKGHQRCDEIRYTKKFNPTSPRKKSHCGDHPQHAAVKGHAALPDRQNFLGMLQVITRLIKQYVAQPTSEHHTDHAEQQQII